MPHAQFGEATRGEIRQRFPDVLPTEIHDEGHSPEVRSLQAVHFDVCFRHPDSPRLAQASPLDMGADELEVLQSILLPQLRDELLPLFEPRAPKYTARRRPPGTMGIGR